MYVGCEAPDKARAMMEDRPPPPENRTSTLNAAVTFADWAFIAGAFILVSCAVVIAMVGIAVLGGFK